jgi:hypothetical protein
MMHPDFLQQLMDDRKHELDQRNRHAYFNEPGANRVPQPVETLVLRLCCVGDDNALEQLAELEGKPVPRGRQIVAEIDGKVVAAIPLGGGAALADPFRSTAHLIPLLELRAKQLETSVRRSGSLWGAVRSWSRA